MGTYVALRDRRLSGGVPARSNLHIVNTSGTTPLGQAFASINSAARSAGGLQAMFILCHGYAGTNDRARVCMDAGGMGLQLGREDVLRQRGDVDGHPPQGGAHHRVLVRRGEHGAAEPGNAGGRPLSDGRAGHSHQRQRVRGRSYSVVPQPQGRCRPLRQRIERADGRDDAAAHRHLPGIGCRERAR